MTADKQPKGKAGSKWWLVLLVALIMAFFTFVGVYMSAIFTVFDNSDITTSIAGFCIALICNVCGGLLIGIWVRHRGPLCGLLAALIADVMFLLAIIIINIKTDSEISISWIVLGVVIVLLILPGFGVLGGFWGERLRNRRTRTLS